MIKGSLIMNKSTGDATWLREEAGNHMLDAWIPPPQRGSNRKKKFAQTAVTNKIGVRPICRHNRAVRRSLN